MRERMTLRATVQRNTETGTDGHGQPLPPVWAAHLTAACWVYNDGKRLVTDGNKIASVEALKIALPLDIDVTDADRLTEIKDRRGYILFPGNFEIKNITRKYNHAEADLKAIR